MRAQMIAITRPLPAAAARRQCVDKKTAVRMTGRALLAAGMVQCGISSAVTADQVNQLPLVDLAPQTNRHVVIAAARPPQAAAL